MAALAPVHPDKLSIHPLDGGGFGIDVGWWDAQGDHRADLVRSLLAHAQVEAELRESLEGGRSELHVGPVSGTDVPRVIDQFVCAQRP